MQQVGKSAADVGHCLALKLGSTQRKASGKCVSLCLRVIFIGKYEMLLSHSREELCSKCEPAAQESPRKPHPSSTTTTLTTGAFHSRSRHQTETVQFKEQQQIAQKNNSNKSLPTPRI